MCEFCHSRSPIDGIALLFVSECLLYPTLGSPPVPTSPPVNVIRDITVILPQKPWHLNTL